MHGSVMIYFISRSESYIVSNDREMDDEEPQTRIRASRLVEEDDSSEQGASNTVPEVNTQPRDRRPAKSVAFHKQRIIITNIMIVDCDD